MINLIDKMAQLQAIKHSEGEAHMKSAEKHLKTGFFKWNPDYDSAISDYNKAATAFKNAKALEEAANAYMKAADAQRANGSVFHAAKALESAAMMYKEQKQLEKAVHYINQAATWYLEDGVPDTAGIALERAAKMVEAELPLKAVELYLRCCDVGEQEDRPQQCAESMGKVGRLYIKLNKLSDAAKALTQEIEFYNQVDNNGLVNKLVMGLVLVYLHMGDSVAAAKTYQAALSYPGFAESDEAGPIGGVIQAYDECDQEEAVRCVNDPLFRSMENSFTKLARDLRVPGGGIKKKPTSEPANPPPNSAECAAESGLFGEEEEEAGASNFEAPPANTQPGEDEEEEFDLR